ncbi:hypothetical protein LWI29_008876 [Acer saccharum]|uniref:Malectin-like domain-containing protein n=1 Tax=Acer saccharum TaxID=4024 RepID=A0AA39SPA0_ACESA|nr:hypothetical protein LWI29_008876 [Acer saccharum]
MDDGERLFLAVKLWLVLVPVIITVISNSKLVAACDEVFEADALGFISINCGASVDYNDNETSLLYVSDTCMDAGEIHDISPNITSMNLYQQQRKNLRSFPQGTRNCYTLKLKLEQGTKNNYLIRAVFVYGNYDGMATGSKKERSLKSKNQPYSYSEIVSITDNFKTVIGEGGYYGTLKDKTEVAVKVLFPS